MKNLKRSIISILVMLLLVVSAFIPSFAAETSEPASYSSSSNSGQRDVVCTTLDGTSAAAYYAGYEYDTLSNLSQDALKAELDELMTETHDYISSYNDCHYEANRTDCENGEGNVILIYTSYPATMSQWNGWNREHVWPQSLGGGNTTGGGADLHHVRPSDAGVNSSRGNKKYGNVNGGTEKYGTNPASGVLGGTYDNTFFEPLDNVKGDVARICLYVMVRWGSSWGATDITDVFESVDVLLEWCEMDPVDTWEMGRNEVVEDIQGNRNVFIDYPEYAWLIFGREVPDDMITPSGEAMGENVSSGTSTTPDTNTGGSILTTTQTTATVTISTYASSNGWVNGTKYPIVKVDENITASASGVSNTGKYYTSGNEWRLYQSESATLTISAAEGCTISSIKITYNASNNGTLIYNDSKLSSPASIVNVNSDLVTLTVGNTGSATNGQAKITKIEVTYTQSASCEHTNTTSATTQVTCTQDGSITVTCKDCGETVSTETIPATGHNYVDNQCTKCGEELPTYAYSIVGPESTESFEIVGNSITLPAAPTLSGTYKQNYVFAGWAKGSVSDTTTAPELFSAGATVTIDEDTTFYAVYTYSAEGEVSTSYVKTDIADIKSTDTVVITMTTSDGTVYALTSGNGTTAAPEATIITVSGNTVTGEVTDILKWNISYDSDGFIIYPNGDTSTWLYCTSSNNGVRVGTNTNKTFTIDSSSGYLKNTATSRYVGVYTTNPDWRCYTNTTGNTANQTLAFYVLPSASGTTMYTSTLEADENSSSCEHTNTTTTTVNANCTTAGSITVTCNECDEVVSTSTIPATGHTEVTDVKVDATCTETGLTEGSHCSTCSTVIVAQETIAATGHSYTDGTCSICGEAKPSDSLGLDGKKFYIATVRSSGNYFYMTSDLGTADTKRYQAVDSGLTTLPGYITYSNDLDQYVFVFEYNGDGTYCIYAYGVAEDAKYLGHTSGNSGTLVEKADALRFTVDYTDGVYNIHFTASDAERYLALNNNAGNDYFAFYKSGQKQDLALIPVSDSTCEHTNTATTVTQNATCTEDGMSVTVCADCKNFISSGTIAALGHDLIDGICSRCGYAESNTTPPDDPTESGWILVTDVSTLQPGDKIIIVAIGTSKGDFIAGDVNSTYLSSIGITDTTFATLPTGAIEFTLGGTSGAWTLSNSSGKLLGSTAAKSVKWSTGTTTWNITIENENATIESTNSSYGRILYNVGSPRFTTYTSNTSVSMVLPKIYKYSGEQSDVTTEVDIYGASVTIGSNLALNYYVSGPAGDGAYMVFSMNNKTSEPVYSSVQNGEYLVFSFKDIPPQCMADVITATLYDKDGNVLIEGFEFSLKEYATKVLEKYADKKDISDLVADMLRYGDAAQTYKNYNKGTILTDDIKTLIDGKGSNLSATDTDNARQLTTAEGTEIDKTLYTFTACGVRFDFDNKLYVKFKATGDSEITFKLNGVTKYAEQLEDGTYVFYTTGINATDFDEVFTFELYVDGVLHQTITYSVNSYVYAKQGATDTNGDPTALAELVLALYNYGISAKNYKS